MRSLGEFHRDLSLIFVCERGVAWEQQAAANERTSATYITAAAPLSLMWPLVAVGRQCNER
jgi:hypothetical protein